MALIKINIAEQSVDSLSAKSDATYAVVNGKLYISDRVSGNVRSAIKNVADAKKGIVSCLTAAKTLDKLKAKAQALPKGSAQRKAAKTKYDVLKARIASRKDSALRKLSAARSDDLNGQAGLSALVLPFTAADLKSGNLKAINAHPAGTFGVRGSDKFMKPTFVKWDKLMTLMGHDPKKLRASDKAREKRTIARLNNR